MFADKDAAFEYALELVEKILENSSISTYPDGTTAEYIADFVEILADRLTKKD